jgi:dTDP-4-dehydrorhamnose reductase
MSEIISQKKRLLLIGANGWLAQFLYANLLRSKIAENIEIYTTYHLNKPFWISENCLQMDLGDFHSIEQTLSEVNPDIILHLAAITAPAKCHQNPDQSTNVNSPTSILHIVKRLNQNALYIFTSTDMVYDGNNPPYLPEFNAAPVNVYGKTKLSFEQQILENLENGIILRLSNMLGPAYQYNPCGEKFLEWLYNAFDKREVIGLKADEVRSFVNVFDVSDLILQIVSRYSSHFTTLSPASWLPFQPENHQDRIFNVGGPTGLSRLDIAKILSAAYETELIIIEKDQSEFVDRSDRSKWFVHVMPPALSTNQPTDCSVLVSPRDITMLSQRTEEVWGVAFQPVAQYIKAHISSMHNN